MVKTLSEEFVEIKKDVRNYIYSLLTRRMVAKRKPVYNYIDYKRL